MTIPPSNHSSPSNSPSSSAFSTPDSWETPPLIPTPLPDIPPLDIGAQALTLSQQPLRVCTITARPSPTDVKTAAVATSNGIIPPKITSKLIVDKNTGQLWRVSIESEGDKPGVLKQREEAFTNIRDEFSRLRLFAELAPTGKNKVLFEPTTNQCIVNGKPSSLAVSPQFLQTYHDELTEGDFDENIVLEKQIAKPTQVSSETDKALAEAEQVLASAPQDRAAKATQKAKLEAIDLDSLNEAQKSKRSALLQQLEVPAAAEKPTKYGTAADEYEGPINQQIPEASHIATMNEINELKGHKVRMHLPKT